MDIYQTKAEIISGTDIKEVQRKAEQLYENITKRTRRRPYLRSRYFQKQKIFLGLFWSHLYQKLNHRDKLRRLKFFSCAMELILNSNHEPTAKENPNKTSEVLYRFVGISKSGKRFFVQIKENKRSGEKFLISIFPDE